MFGRIPRGISSTMSLSPCHLDAVRKPLGAALSLMVKVQMNQRPPIENPVGEG